MIYCTLRCSAVHTHCITSRQQKFFIVIHWGDTRHTPFLLNGLEESYCLIICFRRPRLGSSKSFLPASFFEMFTRIDPTCSNGSSETCETKDIREYSDIHMTIFEWLQNEQFEAKNFCFCNTKMWSWPSKMQTILEPKHLCPTKQNINFQDLMAAINSQDYLKWSKEQEANFILCFFIDMYQV